MYYTIIHTIGIQEFIKIDDTKCKFRHVKVSQNISSTINHQPSTSKSISPQQNMEINEHIEDLKKKLKNIFNNTFRKKEKNSPRKVIKNVPDDCPEGFRYYDVFAAHDNERLFRRVIAPIESFPRQRCGKDKKIYMKNSRRKEKKRKNDDGRI